MARGVIGLCAMADNYATNAPTRRTTAKQTEQHGSQ